ncbi:unnamed protein product [Adineta steineri]|uniref:G-protein coupled receptors family 1 profile domain-containing protein n=1 Tax=Adineta steineri TaxID=433720 RepID=A0A815VL40_9BILA|nr:unnamed protein product [Adineta steineri]CAF1653390.1 unnamed protein product [Adineta steineri]
MITSGSLTGLFSKEEISLPRQVRFWLFLILVIPSIYCSCVLLFQLFVNKKFRSQLSNHIIICLLILGLIIELIDISFHLSFLQLGSVWPSTPTLCTVWWFVDTGIYNGCVIIMAWGSIHRYLLIFHDRLFLTAKKRFLHHMIPLFILILYIFIFYTVVIIFPPCSNTYNYNLPVCGEFPCYLDIPLLGIWDTVINSIVPTTIITIFSMIVLVRVYIKKRRLNRANRWRRQRKMTIQLFSICILYLAANVPLNLVIFSHICGLPYHFGADVQVYANYLCYFVTLLFPFVCLSTLSEMRKKLQWKGLLLFRRSQYIGTINPK